MSRENKSEARKEHLEKQVLTYLNENPDGFDNSLRFLESIGGTFEEHESFIGVLRSLNTGEYISITPTSHEKLVLTAEGAQYKEMGSPEAQVFNAVPEDRVGIPRAELEAKVGKAVFSIGFMQCMKQRWVELSKPTQSVLRKVESIVDETQKHLVAIDTDPKSVDAKTVTELRRRKLVSLLTYQTFAVRKGARFSVEKRVVYTDLTPEMIASGDWKDKEFKEFNFSSLGTPILCGTLHPLMKVRAEFRSILLEMGFSEMPTNQYVENSFWNFDSLFQPQQHPARDSHDTFFLSSPATCGPLPKEYTARVKEVHEKGGYGSIGYRYDWKEEEARKNILRTHTTAVSSRMLYKLAQNKPFKPAKYFSIDRVFRNETLDATHLAEFHQIEGLIADRNLTLGDLIGTIKTFFEKIDVSDVRFKPAYNPYTEPSMEIFGYSKQLKKWIEVGNSGVFRPEMLRPMGLPEDVRVIAWGLSLERPTMIKYGIKNIRDLFGPKVRLDLIATNPLCRYESDMQDDDATAAS